MLKSLKYSNTFPTTGRTLSGDVSFQKGFGTITGPNESGKSFILELIRFSLFGSSALRGKADDYKRLQAELVIEIRGVEYIITRNGATASISTDGKPIAVGVKPVNLKVIEVLGFGMDVFDIACVANQDDLNRLSSMKPTERKQMVDSVIGLKMIDDLSKWAQDKATEANREATAIERVMVAPHHVEEPVGYVPSDQLKAKIAELDALNKESVALRAIADVPLVAPIEPQTSINQPSSELRGLMDHYFALKAKEKQITLPPIPPSVPRETLLAMQEQHDAAHKWQERLRFEKLHPLADYTADQLAEMDVVWEQIDTYNKNRKLQSQIDELMKHGTNECPACNHSWPVAQAQIEDLKAMLDDSIEVLPQPPALPRHAIKIQYERLADKTPRPTDPEVATPTISRQDITNMLRQWDLSTDREKALSELAEVQAELNGMPDYAVIYKERVQYEANVAAYEIALEKYNTALAEREVILSKLAELTPKIEPLSAMREQYMIAATYESSKSHYEAELVKYYQIKEEVDRLKAQTAAWKKAKDALILLRSLVKQQLIPSLNKVASTLLQAMTGAQRQSVVVDDEFNVMVDGQALDTLSGSGKAVTNLALRLGLGQVLTNNVLSLFMGDEIDASMDKSRAENTSNTLWLLKDRIGQILLVTHKYPVSDYYIELGSNDKDTTTGTA